MSSPTASAAPSVHMRPTPGKQHLCPGPRGGLTCPRLREVQARDYLVPQKEVSSEQPKRLKLQLLESFPFPCEFICSKLKKRAGAKDQPLILPHPGAWRLYPKSELAGTYCL